MTDEQIQAVWDVACKDTPQNPGWNRHIRYARAIIAQARAELIAELAPIEWRITYRDPAVGRQRIVVLEHNAIADYRDIDPTATCTPLAAIPTTKEGHE